MTVDPLRPNCYCQGQGGSEQQAFSSSTIYIHPSSVASNAIPTPHKTRNSVKGTISMGYHKIAKWLNRRLIIHGHMYGSHIYACMLTGCCIYRRYMSRSRFLSCIGDRLRLLVRRSLSYRRPLSLLVGRRRSSRGRSSSLRRPPASSCL